MLQRNRRLRRRKANHDKGFEIVGVSLDSDAAGPARYVKKHGYTWPQTVVSDAAVAQAMQHKLEFEGIPHCILIDRAGVVQSTDAEGNWQRDIEALLKEPAPAAGSKR